MERNKSNILTILLNLEHMFQCFRYTTNGTARKVQSLALAVEAQALSHKLTLASKRWKYMLPFKEACDVDFSRWYKNVNRWIDLLSCNDDSSDQIDLEFFTPGDSFFIDQYYYLISNEEDKDSSEPPFYETTDIESYNIAYEEFKDELERDWFDFMEQFDKSDLQQFDNIVCTDPSSEFQFIEKIKVQEVVSTLQSIHEDTDYLDICINSLIVLSDTLDSAYNTLLSPDEEAYKNLTRRLSDTYFFDLIDESINSFKRWKSSAPTTNRLVAFKNKFEREKNKFFSGKWEKALKFYFSIDAIDCCNEADAGKLIFKYRSEFTHDEVGQILADYKKLECYHKEIAVLESNQPKKPINSKPSQSVLQVDIPLVMIKTFEQNKEAFYLFVKILSSCQSEICNRKGKTWGHLKDSFIKLEFIDRNCSGTDFGAAIEQLCPNRNAKNVEQTLKRYNSRNPRVIDIHKEHGIIETFVELFRPVKDMLDKSNNE